MVGSFGMGGAYRTVRTGGWTGLARKREWNSKLAFATRGRGRRTLNVTSGLSARAQNAAE